MEKMYYLDNAATTKVFDEVFDLIKQNNEYYFFNPSASYTQAIMTKKQLDDSRKIILNALKGLTGDLYFTGSATESNNTVFEGVHLRKGDIVLISKGEHPSVYNAAHRLEKKGVIVKDIPLNSEGVVDFEKFKDMMTKEVCLVSVVHVSNETGAINNIKQICSYSKMVNPKVLVHSDGVQAFGKITVNLLDMGVDMYSISAHKIYAPRGVAALWVKKNVVIDPFLVGGGQENGFRSSTENVAGAIAFAFSVNKVVKEQKANYELVNKYKNDFLTRLKDSQIAKYMIVNSTENCSSYIISLSFKGIKGEVLMHALEQDGVLISTGSACSSKKMGNRTLEAMGVQDVVGSVRVSFSPYHNYDFEYIVEAFVKNVLRFESNNEIIK